MQDDNADSLGLELLGEENAHHIRGGLAHMMTVVVTLRVLSGAPSDGTALVIKINQNGLYENEEERTLRGDHRHLRVLTE